MIRIFLLPAALLATASFAAPPEPAPGPRECFWASQVTGFSDAGPKRALVNIGSRETWELTLSPGCPAVNWALNIGIRARSGERICPGRPAELLVPNASESGFQRCLVRDIRKLSRKEAAAARGEP
ncbi:MAG: DUF6491 family protein [Pseudomonadota bacterium]